MSNAQARTHKPLIKIKGYIAMDQTRNIFEFEIEKDASDEEIEEAAKAEAFDFIDWGWEKA